MITHIAASIAAIAILNIIYQIFASDGWLQYKLFDRKVNLLQLEGTHGSINIDINDTSFEVKVKHGIVENCRINICGPYSNTTVFINDEPMCMIHRISDIASIFMRRSVEYNNKYRATEIDTIINAAYKVAKKRRNTRYDHLSNTRTKSLYEKERGE